LSIVIIVGVAGFMLPLLIATILKLFSPTILIIFSLNLLKI
jgi:hypothetical protein